MQQIKQNQYAQSLFKHSSSLTLSIFLLFYPMILMLRSLLFNNFILKTVRGKCNRFNIISMSNWRNMTSSIFLLFYHLIMMLISFLLIYKIILKSVRWKCNRINKISMSSECLNNWVVWHFPYLYSIIIRWCQEVSY